MSKSLARSQSPYLMVSVFQDQPRGHQILDVRRDYRPLMKEIGVRAVAAEPGFAGHQWAPRMRHEDNGSFPIILEAHLSRPNGRCGAKLATMAIPRQNFAWIARRIAGAEGLRGRYYYDVEVLPPDHPLVGQSESLNEDDDITLVDEEDKPLVLPEGFRYGEPPFPRRIIDAAPTWLRCVFMEQALSPFLQAAAQEREAERGWAGAGSVHLTPDACYVVVHQLVDVPAAQAGREFIHTRGRDFLELCQRVCTRLTAYMHLHPPEVDGQKMMPFPSAADSVLAWNFSLASSLPCCFPIALFGTDPDAPGGSLAAHAYEAGMLTRVQLECSVHD